MPWKVDENGQIEVKDGNPVFIHGDKSEAPFDGDGTVKTIAALKMESQTRREKLQSFKKIMEPLKDVGVNIDTGEGLGDYIKSSADAVETVKNFNDSDLVKADEVEKIKKSQKDAYEKKLADQDKAYKSVIERKETRINKLDKTLRDRLIRSEFENSTFIRKKTVLLPEFAYSNFAKNFEFEEKDGILVPFAVDGKGDRIYSLKNPGQLATPEEAIEILINSHPNKEGLLRGSDVAGGGGQPSFDAGGRTTIPKGDPVAFGANIEDIASGKKRVAVDQ